MNELIDGISDLRSDDIVGPLEAAEFLQVSEDTFMNAVLKGYLPGGCIDGQWRFSKWGLKKFCLQRNNHALGAPWAEAKNPHFFGDFGKNKTQEVLDAYKQGKRYFPLLNIEGARFAGLDLPGIDFWECSLEGADFTNAVLKNASFVATDLRFAIFEGADLTDADFRGAFAENVNFRGANLNRTIFQVSSMSGADLSGARINIAKF